MSKTVYETVCAFLNTKGGDILLNEIIIDGKAILHIFVPEASVVHRCDSRVFLRNNSGDFDITNKHQEISTLYFRKQTAYSENRVFPYAEMSDMRKDIFKKVRRIVTIENSSHPWRAMSDLELLKNASFFLKDPATGQEGITLAGILIFGKDELIAAAAPAFRIDMLKRVIDTDRYDDRLDLRTNLIESYEKAMQFAGKHLPNPFHLEGVQSISLRENIFREVIINMLIHKEYARAEPTRFIIEKERVYTENSNKPYISGIIDLSNLVPHPKNPNIARFFRQIGRAEELGSGVRKIYKYCKVYSGYNPVITDDNDCFRFILPIDFFKEDTKDSQVSDQVSDQVEKRNNEIVSFCKTPKTSEEIQNLVGIVHKTYFRTKILNPLIEAGKLARTVSDKANSKNQKYVTVVV